MTELQHFREPLQENALDFSDRYNGYHIPNGYRVKERPKRKYFWLKIALGSLILAAIGVLVFAGVYFSQLACDCQYPVPTDFACDPVSTSQMSTNPASTPSPFNYTTDVEVKQEMILVNDTLIPENYRLPRDLIPESYKIQIIPYFKDNWTTSGQVSIKFKCVTETDHIILNIKHLRLEKSSLKVTSEPNGEGLAINHTEHDEKAETFTIHLQEKLSAGVDYTVFIKYIGKIKNSPSGLYKTVFYINDNIKSFMVNTLFSPSDARSVYPCFDEPAFKARFTFSIGRPATFTSLSNMRINYTEPLRKIIADYELDHYSETPLMSTYLTAFMISQYRPLHTIQPHTDVSFTSYSKHSDIPLMTYVMMLSADIMAKMEGFFQIKYPLPKLDIVAVPEQYFQAMENWGILVFRENVAFVDNTTTESKKQDTALILAHEIAHQWFGNLVTPKWWDNLWLKEGFATYYAYRAIDEVFPSWSIQDKFQFEVMQQAFKIDALESSSAMAKSVIRPSYEIFDDISYNKGAAIVRMMSYSLGSTVMEQAIVAYLKEYSYKNADQDDLWTCLMDRLPQVNVTHPIDVKRVMDSWTLQAGYPLINFMRDYESGSAVVTQERFLLNEGKDNTSKWWIPLSYTSEDNPNFRDTAPKIWINESQTLINRLPKGQRWVVANLDQAGLYLVNYDLLNWKLLIDAFEVFPDNTKAQLLSDSLHLAQSSKLPYDIALSLIFLLTKEVHYLPWKAVAEPIYTLENLLKNMPVYGNFRTFILTMLERVYTKIAKNADPWSEANDVPEQIHMENIITIACHFDSPHCTAKAVQLYDGWMNTEINTIPEAIRKVTYCTALKKGTPRRWEFTLNILKETKDIVEKRRLLHALGCVKETWLLTSTLGFILPNNEINLNVEEILEVFESVASNDMGHQIAMNFVRSQWPYLLDRFGSPSVIGRMISNLVGYINNQFQVEELKSLVGDIEEKIEDKSMLLIKAQERAENNIIWMKNNYKEVTSFINMVRKQYNLK